MKIPILILTIVALAMVSFAAEPSRKRSAIIARGRYLVEAIGMCADCHSPRTADGTPDRSKWLQGAPLAFAPKEPIPGFSGYAPAIAGLPGWTDAEAITVLTTGLTSGGKRLAPPMPSYRLVRADAVAVVAYLRSLASGD